MPTIVSSADLRNSYNKISQQCNEFGEPIFVTKNGKGDLAVMSIEAYEDMRSRLELYEKITDGLDDIETGHTRPLDEALTALKSRRHK